MCLPRCMTRALDVTARPDLVKLRFGQYLILPTVLVLFLRDGDLKRGSAQYSQTAISPPRRAMTPGDIIATISYVCLVFSCASVLLRVVVRYKWLDAGLRLDDWFMIVALVSLSFCKSLE